MQALGTGDDDREFSIDLPTPHPKQRLFVESTAKRKVIRAGRRGGKTIGAAIIAVRAYRAGRRVLYAAPTDEQIERFWVTIKRALQEPIDAGYYYKNESKHIIELRGTEQRIRAKTAWDADTLRGDYADLLILDEYQGMKPNAWEIVGAPMLLDNDGDAIFIYTTRMGQKGDHARKLFNYASGDKSGRWEAFTFPSQANPHLSELALNEIADDMADMYYRMEILAEELDDDPSALWTRDSIDQTRVLGLPPGIVLSRMVVGVDPPGSVHTECGIVVAGSAKIGDDVHAYIFEDGSIAGRPDEWGSEVVVMYRKYKADSVLGETNYGGDMVEGTIESVVKLDKDKSFVAYKKVNATRGKAVRAAPVQALYAKGLVHHIGTFRELEDEMCTWVPDSGMRSPNRLDAMVWCVTELLVGAAPADWDSVAGLGTVEGFKSVWD